MCHLGFLSWAEALVAHELCRVPRYLPPTPITLCSPNCGAFRLTVYLLDINKLKLSWNLRICFVRRSVFPRIRELPWGDSEFSHVPGAWAGWVYLSPPGDCGDLGVQEQDQVKSYSAITIRAPSFQESEVTAGASVLWGCLKELQGSEEEKEFGVWAACPGDRAGPLGPRAGLCCPEVEQVPSPEAGSLFPSQEGGAPALSPRMESVI